MLWADLDPISRSAYLEELAARGVFPHEAVNLDSASEPVWVNAAGDFVRADGAVLPVVTLTDPAGIDLPKWALWVIGGMAVVLLAG